MFGINKLTDHSVLERMKQGDEQMLVHLYKQHHTMVKNFVLKNSGDENVVDDILQDTVIAVWKNVHKPDFMLQSKLSTYILAIAKNLWFKDLNTPSEEMNLNMDQSLIVQMVEEMDETCRKLLSYFYFDGFNNVLIAEKLGFANANTVKSKKYQCFKKLQASVVEKYKKEDLL